MQPYPSSGRVRMIWLKLSRLFIWLDRYFPFWFLPLFLVAISLTSRSLSPRVQLLGLFLVLAFIGIMMGGTMLFGRCPLQVARDYCRNKHQRRIHALTFDDDSSTE